MAQKQTKLRMESDLLGAIEVPLKAPWGAQTQRAINNFPLNTSKSIGDYPELIHGLLYCKIAAALVNRDLSLITPQIANAIIEVGKMLLSHQDYPEFPIHYLHGGGGTSANMNANEVLANFAEEILGGNRGDYQLVHPNDHVNKNQSTNDVYPTACHIAIISRWEKTYPLFAAFTASLQRRSENLVDVQKIARTCLQDAVDITYGDFLGGYSSQMDRIVREITQSIQNLHEINLGGTIVGRSTDVPHEYMDKIIPAIQSVTQDSQYSHAQNLFDAAQNPDTLALISAKLAILARSLIKIAKDFRIMASGPETGFGEIILPAVQPGSSIMPGKINPVIPEFLIQLCFQVIGNNAACQAGLEHGEFDLNIWESSMTFNILDSIELLATAVSTFDAKCFQQFTINQKRNQKNIDSIIPLLTQLMHTHGYSKISNICKKAPNDLVRLKELLKEEQLID